MSDGQPGVTDLANLVDLLRCRAALGGAKGFCFLPQSGAEEIRLSFAELDLRARSLAAVLQERGLAGQRALLCYPAGVEFLVGLFGSLYAGAVAVPLYPPRAHRGDARLDSIVDNCDAAIVLTTDAVCRDFQRLTAFTPRLRGIPCLSTSDLPPARAENWCDPQSPRDALAILQYTSGSTGTPRGVMLNHTCVLHNLVRMRQVLGLNTDTDGVSWLPAFHDMGLIGNFLQAVLCGGNLTVLSPAAFVQEPLRWLQAISRQRAYISGGPCFAFQHCVSRLTAKKCSGLDLSSWQVAYVGAEPVSAAVLDAFVDAFTPFGFRREAFLPTYGLAEATLMVSGGDRRAQPVVRSFAPASLHENRAEPDANGRQLVACGPAVADMEVVIVDAATGTPLPDGQVGEIWVRGPSIAAGYWNRPDESVQTFSACRADRPGVPYLRTGDLGFLHDGELFISGRLKELIIIYGRNYYPQDIEATVTAACPELHGQSSAAFAVPAEAVPQLVVVHEVPRGYQPGAGQTLFDRAQQAIAELFELRLHALVLVKTASLPKSSSGKIRRGECSRLFQAGELETIEHLQVTAAVETPAPVGTAAPAITTAAVRQWLTRRLAQQLQVPVERIEVDRPFAAFGLDSVALLAMAGDLQEWLRRPVSATEFYSAPTIATLARHLGSEASDRERSPRGAERPVGLVPVAVVGMGCRYPHCDGPEQFWEALRDGRCLIGPLPAGRWPHVPEAVANAEGGYLADVEHFDAAFFGIAPREAVFIDPQHRILLETAWAALEHAGLAPDCLAGSATGVFVGISTADYSRLLLAHAGYADPYLGTGNSASMAAHRLSYHLDLRGPSAAVDTACSSSLVAVHLACQSLRNGECDLALAAGVNLILAPELTEAFSRAGMLSPAGRCKTFDAAADGYVRGEGCAVLVLKLLPAALRDGDPIFAVLEASAVNQDGRSNGITAPNGAAQADLIQRTLRLAGRTPGQISYVEAHGTGTSLGDPIEFEGLQAALGTARQPCALGAVKTNVGHLEAAAGITSLIKTVLQVHHGQVAPHLHLEVLNPRIALAASRFHIPRALEPWEGDRVAGVSAFGFGGTNAHVIVAQAPPCPAPPPTCQRPLHLLPLSAKSALALRALAMRFAELLKQDATAAAPAVCAAAARGRCHFDHRLAVWGADNRALAESLERWAVGEPTTTCCAGVGAQELTGRVAFLFTGQGSQYAGMARQLYETCRVFREALDQCAGILRGCGFDPLRALLNGATRLDETDVAQPALFPLEYALAQTWRHWGVEPAAVLGHSVGEYVAACLAGVLSLEDGLRLIAERGRLMQACPAGAMLACFAPLAAIEECLGRWHNELTVAVVNGPESVVVAGAAESAVAAQEDFAAHDIPTRLLRVRRAFHSSLVDPALPGLRAAAAALTHRAPTIPLVSNLTGQFWTGAPAADYWAEHARGTVQFAAGLQTLHQAGITHFLEVGPDAVLSRLGPACVTSGGAVWLSSLRRDGEDWSGLLASLARLYANGARIDWEHFHDDIPRGHVALPTYPFQRQRYWIDAVPRAARRPDSGAEKAAEKVNVPFWRPLSNWAECLPRSASGFDALSGGLEGVLAPVVAEVKQRHALEQMTAVRGDFDRLAGSYVRRALTELGWRPNAGDHIGTEALAAHLGVLPSYRRLLGRLLAMAAEDGWLQRIADGWRVAEVPAQADVAGEQQAMLDRFPAFAAEIQLAHRCASRMPAVMRGQEDPLHVLFGDDAARLTEQLYERSPVSSFYNDLVVRTVHELAGSLAVRRPVRIVEVGAGTGGTTAHVLKALPADRVEYVFSDVSRLFLAQAHEKFRRFPFVQYRLLDLEKELTEQGFAGGQFDLVLAANVFHATSELRRCVRSARRLLAPSGVLVLLEGTGPRRLLDLIFGLTEGWWKFADTDLRADYPLLSPERWLELLCEEGFDEASAAPAADAQLPDPDQVVLLARTGKAAVNSEPAAVPRNGTAATWVLVGDRAGLADEVTRRLTASGATVIRVETQEMLDEVRTHTPASALRVVDLSGTPATCAADEFGDRWTVTCGAVSLDSTADWPVPAGKARFIDLDPNQAPAEHALCLCEALLHPDVQRVVVYRGDQRYVSTGQDDHQPDHAAQSGSFDRAALLAAAPFERRALVESHLRREFAAVLGLELSGEDLNRPLQSFGLDSLMGLQFRNRVEAALGVSLSIVAILRGASLSQIIDSALADLDQQKPPAPAEQPLPDNLTAEGVERLSEGEIDNLLQSLLEQ
jgi:acyl transferase domain-containing protein/acyl-CoA synthetase (AMP-forming)/AMP-acid ligase II/SAM-dependent methyltransferase/acyl carrier protein